MESSIENRTLIEDSYNKIKHMILHQKVSPGQRLVYSDLCQLFKMSRTPIISALTRLEQEGFLVSMPFRGFQVKPIDLQEIWDLFGVREALEAYAVELVIGRIEPNDIELLEKKCKIHEEYTPSRYDRKKFLMDSEFHLQLAEITRNRELIKTLRIYIEHVNLRFRLDNCDTGRMHNASEEHKELLSSIKKRDVLKSVEIMRRHMRNGRDFCINCLSTDESSIL